MPLRALTIDFWNTLVVARTNGAGRLAMRMEQLLEVARAHTPGLTAETVSAAYREAERRFEADWRARHLTPATTELVRCIWEALALEVDADRHDACVRVFEESILHHPPALADGAAEALAWAAGRYRLALISDTMFSPGRVLRRVLDARGLLAFFDAFVFSDEMGYAKPDVRAFETAAAALGVAPGEAAHIGDLRRTDVAGARQAGARAILYTGAQHDAEPGPAPDAVLRHWNELPGVLARLEARSPHDS